MIYKNLHLLQFIVN